jgi:hypothetical protein
VNIRSRELSAVGIFALSALGQYECPEFDNKREPWESKKRKHRAQSGGTNPVCVKMIIPGKRKRKP